MNIDSICIIALSIIILMQQFQIYSLNKRATMLLKMCSLLTNVAQNQNNMMKKLLDWLKENFATDAKQK